MVEQFGKSAICALNSDNSLESLVGKSPASLTKENVVVSLEAAFVGTLQSLWEKTKDFVSKIASTKGRMLRYLEENHPYVDVQLNDFPIQSEIKKYYRIPDGVAKATALMHHLTPKDDSENTQDKLNQIVHLQENWIDQYVGEYVPESSEEFKSICKSGKCSELGWNKSAVDELKRVLVQWLTDETCDKSLKFAESIAKTRKAIVDRIHSNNNASSETDQIQLRIYRSRFIFFNNSAKFSMSKCAFLFKLYQRLVSAKPSE